MFENNVFFTILLHLINFSTVESSNDIWKGDNPLLKSYHSQHHGEAGGAGWEEYQGDDQPRWERGGGEQADDADGEEEDEREEKKEGLRLPGLDQSFCHKLSQIVLIPLVQLVLMALLIFPVVAFLLLLPLLHVEPNFHSLVVAEAEIISRNP